MTNVHSLSQRLRHDHYILLENQQHRPFNKHHAFINHITDSSPAQSKSVVQSILCQKMINHKIENYKRTLGSPSQYSTNSLLQKQFPLFKKKYKGDLQRDHQLQRAIQEDYTVIDKQSYLSSRTLDLNKKILIIITNETESKHHCLNLGPRQHVNTSFHGLRQLNVDRLEGGQPEENKHHLHSTAFRRKSLENNPSFSNKQVRFNNLYDAVIQQKLLQQKHIHYLKKLIGKSFQCSRPPISRSSKILQRVNNKLHIRSRLTTFQENKSPSSHQQTPPAPTPKGLPISIHEALKVYAQKKQVLNIMAKKKKSKAEASPKKSSRHSASLCPSQATIKNVYKVSSGRLNTLLHQRIQLPIKTERQLHFSEYAHKDTPSLSARGTSACPPKQTLPQKHKAQNISISSFFKRPQILAKSQTPKTIQSMVRTQFAELSEIPVMSHPMTARAKPCTPSRPKVNKGEMYLSWKKSSSKKEMTQQT